MSALFSGKKEGAFVKKETSSVRSKKKSDGVLAVGVSGRSLSASILLEPVITEKAHAVNVQNKHVFLVSTRARKDIIKRAIEELYGVDVLKVTVSVMKPRKRVYGRIAGMTKELKKAVITVKKGQSIDLFKGV